MGWEGESGRWRKGLGSWTEKGCWSEQQVGMGLTGHESCPQALGELIPVFQGLANYNPQTKSSLLPDFANTCYLLLSAAVFLL